MQTSRKTTKQKVKESRESATQMEARSVCLHFKSVPTEHSEGAHKKLGSLKEGNTNPNHTFSVLDFQGRTHSEELPKFPKSKRT